MEISRRHLQDTEQQELRRALDETFGELSIPLTQEDEIERMKDHMVEMSGGAIDRALIQVQTRQSQPDAAEMQRQVDGLTRNQRRVLVKRMKKHRK